MPVHSFPFAGSDDDSLHDRLVVVEQQFAGNIQVLDMTGVRRRFAVLVGTRANAENHE